MAVLSSCLCCSLLLGTIIAGVFTTMVYLAAFILSLWWIVEAEASGSTEGSGGMVNGSTPPIPVPAYLLCFGYLIVTAASIFMLLGLYKKRDRALLLWVFVMTLFCFPEMGMVAFMAFVHWGSVQQGGVNGETTLAYHNPAFVSSPETPTATLTTSPTSLSSRSEAALHTGPAGGLTVYHHTPQLFYPYPLADQYYSTQSLDRRRAGLLAGPGLVRPPHESRSSLGAESDDLRKYRDVAL
ncbi:hypothetical protein Hamer_G019746 [Homarus americanus]|uniref:Uncharacterized protein n=1 Tax=Homarus americanus TaxID=6706 RepID=A0A8J5KEX9_HOMAM|nr:hypothetical protein Hamer_G019746 [Homarus americanus]